MENKRLPTLMAALRAEMAPFVIFCVMVLAIPLLQPVAQAHALQTGVDFTICTQDGLVQGPGSGTPGSMPGNCPCVITCNTCIAGTFVKAFQTGSPIEFTPREPGSVLRTAGSTRMAGDETPFGANGIRGPPVSI